MDNKPPSDRWLAGLAFATDVIGFIACFCLAYGLRFDVFDPQLITSWFVLSFTGINVLCLYLFALYDFNPHARPWKMPLQTLAAVFIAGCVIILLAYFLGAVAFHGALGRGVLISAQLLFTLWAATSRFWFSHWFRRASRRLRWLVLGTEEYIRPFIRDLSASPLSGQFVFLTPDGQKIELDHPQPKTLSLQFQGSWNELENLASEPWSGIIACAGNNLPEAIVEKLMEIRLRGVRVSDLADFYEDNWFKVPVYYLQRSWFAMAQGFQLLHNPIGLKLKRVIDACVAGLLLALSMPVLLLTAIAIKLESRGPLIFKQTRVGENGKTFTVYKLRSMRVDAEKNGATWAVVKDPRVTRVGAFIRATRIDEIPQLVNVLRGEMSFIGPRPERPEFTGTLEDAIPFYNLRHILRPGVTGWAQVMYRYGASIDDSREKLQYDLYYIKNYSLLLDAAILMKTVRVVLFGMGR